jgi:hypothetical protein
MARRQNVLAFALIAISALGCRDAVSAKSKRKDPVCATQDCATGKIVDDGCTADGRCTSCVNSCTAPVKPEASGAN